VGSQLISFPASLLDQAGPEVEVLKFLVDWAYLRHMTLELYEFTPKYIAKQLHANKNEIIKAIEKLKRLGLLEDCNSYADSVLRDKIYELCKQYAKNENKPMIFFYR